MIFSEFKKQSIPLGNVNWSIMSMNCECLNHCMWSWQGAKFKFEILSIYCTLQHPYMLLKPLISLNQLGKKKSKDTIISF